MLETSESTAKLDEALAKAQGEMKNAALNKVNPHFKSRYADLAGIRDTVTPALSANGIAVVQAIGSSDGSLAVITRLVHSSGQWFESSFPIIGDVNKPQAIGSAITYGRRYTLSAIANISADDDDDGEQAQEQGSKPPEARNITGTVGARKAASREPYDNLVKEMRQAQSVDALKEWLKLRRSEVEKLPDEWMALFDTDYSDHREALVARAA